MVILARLEPVAKEAHAVFASSQSIFPFRVLKQEPKGVKNIKNMYFNSNQNSFTYVFMEAGITIPVAG